MGYVAPLNQSSSTGILQIGRMLRGEMLALRECFGRTESCIDFPSVLAASEQVSFIPSCYPMAWHGFTYSQRNKSNNGNQILLEQPCLKSDIISGLLACSRNEAGF